MQTSVANYTYYDYIHLHWSCNDNLISYVLPNGLTSVIDKSVDSVPWTINPLNDTEGEGIIIIM